jgi:hypothetical protein
VTELLFFGDKTHKFLFFNPANPNNRITRIDTASGSYLNWKILFPWLANHGKFVLRKNVGRISAAHPPFCAGSVDALRLSTLVDCVM